MRILGVGLVVVVVVSACSSSGPSHSQADCDKIANDIRTAAAARGIDAQGVCANTTAAYYKDFANACSQLKACNDDCCK